jgi:hypothetical protein
MTKTIEVANGIATSGIAVSFHDNSRSFNSSIVVPDRREAP